MKQIQERKNTKYERNKHEGKTDKRKKGLRYMHVCMHIIIQAEIFI